MDLYVPYCGTAPVPADWLTRWNFDPWLLLALASLLALHAAVAARLAGRGPDEAMHRRAFRAGWLLLAFALTSPLCAFSVALFSVRVTQHVVLLLAAAPLLAYGWPRMTRLPPANLAVATAVFTVAFWLWHAPAAYEATFRSTPVYWAMQLSLFATAWVFWRSMFVRAPGSSELARPAALAVTLAQMGLLGALLTFAARLLYSPHVATAIPFGLTALEDQQLGGLVMWVPGGIVPLVVALMLVARLLPRIGQVHAGTMRGSA